MRTCCRIRLSHVNVTSIRDSILDLRNAIVAMHANQTWKTALVLTYLILLTSLTCAAGLHAQIQEDEIDFQILATVTYQRDNSLWSLAGKYYGNPRLWPHIADMNRIADATDIPAGTPIYIPAKGAGRVTRKQVKGIGSGVPTTVAYQKGDTLWSLAERHYGNPYLWPRIANANGVSDKTDIPIGTSIHIPAKDTEKIADKLTVEADSGGLATVTYRKGDTLWSLAEKYYGNPWQWPRIADANGITDAKGISPGTPIHIPVRGAKQIRSRIADTSKISDKTPFPVRRTTHIPAADPKLAIEKLVEAVGFEVMAVVFYQKDDTLQKLAERYYGAPELWSHIADANGISDETMISIGTAIYIPARVPEITVTKPKIPVKEPIQAVKKVSAPNVVPKKPENMTVPLARKQVKPRIADRIAPPFEDYKIVGAKNLFRPLGWQERMSNEPTYILAGTVVKPEKKKALVINEKKRESYYISEGDSIGEAEAIDISEDRVVLSHEDKRTELVLDTSLMFGSRKSSRPRNREAGFPPGKESGVEPQYKSRAPLANRGGPNEYTDRWRSMDRDVRLKFYSYVRGSGSSLGNVLRDADLRNRMLNEFFGEREEGEE
ncbi:LysM peptidoglycan-binding domain-containing protein [Candidatus Poribacteria bacterium]